MCHDPWQIECAMSYKLSPLIHNNGIALPQITDNITIECTESSKCIWLKWITATTTKTATAQFTIDINLSLRMFNANVLNMYIKRLHSGWIVSLNDYRCVCFVKLLFKFILWAIAANIILSMLWQRGQRNKKEYKREAKLWSPSIPIHIYFIVDSWIGVIRLLNHIYLWAFDCSVYLICYKELSLQKCEYNVLKSKGIKQSNKSQK